MMEDVCPGTNMMSFGKVPCTPVAGAYINFYDIFGNVEKLRSGSSGTASFQLNDEDAEEEEHRERESSKTTATVAGVKKKSSSSSSGKRKCSYCYKYGLYEANPQITFLQEKQVEVLGALHDEIRSLKSENADLKFQIHVVLRAHDDSILQENIYRGKMVPSTPETYLGDLRTPRLVQNKEKTLELELESAAKMIEELKWVKLHYEKQIRAQEVKIGHLESQLTSRGTSSCNTPILPLQISPALSPAMTDAGDDVASARHMKSGRQRSPSINFQRELLGRRNSLQSLLPDDYKKAVATLPPILGNGNSSPPQSNPLKVMTMNLNMETLAKCENGKRKSAVALNNHNGLRNSTTPSILSDKIGETEFWYSK